MKTVKRYTTFEALKADVHKRGDEKVSLKRHNDFKKFMAAVYSVKKRKAPSSK